MVGIATIAPAVSPKVGETMPSTMSERSPTRVTDFKLHEARKTGTPVEALMLEPLSTPPSSCPQVPHLRLNLMNTSLPPLIETASVSSENEERDEFPDDESDLFSPISPPPTPRTPREKLREKPPQVKTSRDEFMKLKNIAANLASRGQEADALKAYTRALRLMRNDLSKIKKSMKNALESTIASMQNQLCQAWVQVASEIAEIRTTMAILSERQGDYDTAIKSCEEARIVYQSYANLKTKVHIENKNDDDQLEKMEHMLERLALAKASYSDRKLLHQDAAHVRSCICNEVDPDVKEELYDELFNVLATVLEMEQDSLGKVHPQVADTIAMIAQIHADRGETEEAIETMHSSVSIMRMSLGPLHPRTAITLRDLARLYESEDSDKAIQVYEAAIETFRGSYGSHHAMVGSTLNNVAVIYIKRGELDEAVQTLSDALAAYESGVERGNAINPEVAQVWKNLGECYSLRGEWESALFAYTSALGVQQDARRCHDVLDSTSVDISLDGPIAFDGADDSSYADTMLRLAKATAALGQYDEAVQSYEEALHIYRLMLHKASVEAEGHPSTDMVEAQDRVAHTLYCIAETQEKNVQYDEAVALYTESFDLRLRSDAVRENRRANMVHCAMCLAGIGSVHMHQHEYTDACLVLKESLHFLEAHGKKFLFYQCPFLFIMSSNLLSLFVWCDRRCTS